MQTTEFLPALGMRERKVSPRRHPCGAGLGKLTMHFLGMHTKSKTTSIVIPSDIVIKPAFVNLQMPIRRVSRQNALQISSPLLTLHSSYIKRMKALSKIKAEAAEGS